VSAPVTHDPLVVNTRDGVTWLRRAATQDGRGLYAVTDSCKCPPYLMATLAELAEHGIVGSADVLPVPVGPEPRSELDQARDDVVGACLARWEEEQENARLRLALKSAQRGRRESRARVAELEAERHSTNESLDEAIQELRRRDTPPAPYAATPEAHAQMRRFGMRHFSNARNGACENCGSAPESWCPDCAACEQGCFGGFDGNECTHSKAKWGGAS
jgi:hypothetical protein